MVRWALKQEVHPDTANYLVLVRRCTNCRQIWTWGSHQEDEDELGIIELELFLLVPDGEDAVTWDCHDYIIIFNLSKII